MPLQLKDTAERIKAVDRAAAMVEEMLKQGQNSESVPSNSHLAGNTGVKIYLHYVASFVSWHSDDLHNEYGSLTESGYSGTKHMCVFGLWSRPVLEHCRSYSWTKCEPFFKLYFFSTLHKYTYLRVCVTLF